MRLKNFAANGLVFVAAVFFAITANSGAAEKKEWVTLNDCRYVDSENNDGDSFIVRCGDKEFTARLYYVDAPETNLRYGDRTREQSLHFGITLDETMNAGVRAAERVRALLREPFVLQTLWSTGGGRGREPRYNVLIQVGGKDLGEVLISEGLARAKGVGHSLPSGEKSRGYMDRLAAMEDDARAKRVGAWATASVPSGTPAATSPAASEHLVTPAPAPTVIAASASPYGEYPANYKEIVSAWLKANVRNSSKIDWQGEPKPVDLADTLGRHRYGYLVIFNTPEQSRPKTRSVLIRDGTVISNSGF
jgi:endonuclease YncB( thermonuclease family)